MMDYIVDRLRYRAEWFETDAVLSALMVKAADHIEQQDREITELKRRLAMWESEDDYPQEVVAYRIHCATFGRYVTTRGDDYEAAKSKGEKVEWLGVIGGIEAVDTTADGSTKCGSCGKHWTGRKCANGDPADPCYPEPSAPSQENK